MTGLDLFVYALLCAYVLSRWRLHRWQRQRRTRR